MPTGAAFAASLPHTIALLSFFIIDTPPTDIYTLSLHDALPISDQRRDGDHRHRGDCGHCDCTPDHLDRTQWPRSEEHTSELQSQSNLVCRLLLEKKKNK